MSKLAVTFDNNLNELDLLVLKTLVNWYEDKTAECVPTPNLSGEMERGFNAQVIRKESGRSYGKTLYGISDKQIEESVDKLKKTKFEIELHESEEIIKLDGKVLSVATVSFCECDGETVTSHILFGCPFDLSSEIAELESTKNYLIGEKK